MPDIKLKIDKLVDAFLLRPGGDEDSHSTSPGITTGAIVWGVLFRSAIIIIGSLFLFEAMELYNYWWISLFALWFLAVYPGWQQYNKFSQRMEEFTETTLCGSCRNFDPSSQLCTKYDEHVSAEYVPCEGMDWEPK
ncbi:MAG: hypothetical protein ACLFR2_00900 [Candidatus Kapaibacterium sp.]